MPQTDRHKERTIPIEFDFYDTLQSLPARDRCSIVLFTCGTATVNINSHYQTVPAPSVLCLSQYDTFSLVNSDNLSAKTFHFDPWYIKACLAFENLDEDIEIDEHYTYDRQMLYMFTKHSGNFQGIFRLTPQQYLHINELMLMIGGETYAQSDGFWTCRIRRMLLQALNCIYDIYMDQRKLHFFELTENTNPATICADYIHANYNREISLETLCKLVNLNRTSLNQRFKEQYQCTCMEYLLRYRLKIAQELLSNTNMKIAEVAENCGFKYDTYFEKQFKHRLGISPAMYRKNPLGYTAFEGNGEIKSISQM
ncbi:MAG: helix-turn-helix transcriptional regulator [Lachnospiraceae bacterium]|nr:helix-turn-helix transcriptional regulator [Lachnospiraceae bacterium]